MRRPSKYSKIHRIWPFLNWTKCDLCEMEFKYECGWRIEVAGNMYYQNIHLCKFCAPKKEDIEQHIQTAEFKKRPHIPQCPPCKPPKNYNGSSFEPSMPTHPPEGEPPAPPPVPDNDPSLA